MLKESELIQTPAKKSKKGPSMIIFKGKKYAIPEETAISCLKNVHFQLAKTLSFIVDEKPVIVVMAGDGRVNSSKFKALFHTKPSMIARDKVEEITGFAPGGVCPFNVPKDIPVWLDVSMKRFEYIYPAGGNEFTSVKLTPAELEQASDATGWCDVCKGWEE